MVIFKNFILNNPDKQDSSNIGISNCRAIMDKHGGSFEISKQDSIIIITLKFPTLENIE